MEREQVEERERSGTERTWDTCCPAKQTTARERVCLALFGHHAFRVDRVWRLSVRHRSSDSASHLCLSATRSRSHACQIAEIYPQPSLLAFLPLKPPFAPSFHHLSSANHASHRRHRQLQGATLLCLPELSSMLNSPPSLTTR